MATRNRLYKLYYLLRKKGNEVNVKDRTVYRRAKLLPAIEEKWMKDVWNYIRERGLPYSKYYDAPYNLSRHGCIGCPLCNYRQMQLEFKMFPGYAKRMIVAIERYMSTHPNGFLARNFADGYEAFYYYINEVSIADFHEQKKGLFRFSAREIIRREILNQLT